MTNKVQVQSVLSLRSFRARHSDSGKAIADEEARELLLSILAECARQQEDFIAQNHDRNWGAEGRRDDAAARASYELTVRLDDYLGQNRWERSNIQEARRLLKAWHERTQVARFLEEHEWRASYDECHEQFRWLKYNQYKNIVRAKELPRLPQVTCPRVLGGTLTDSVMREVTITSEGIWLKDFKAHAIIVDLFFPVSPRLWARYPRLTKIGRPVIRLSRDGVLVFDFLLTTEEEPAAVIPGQPVLGIDPGVRKVFTGALVTASGQVSRELAPSKETQRALRKLALLDDDLRKKRARLERLEALGSSTAALEAEVKAVALKRQRVTEAVDWNASRDVLNLAEVSGARVALEKVRFNDGDNRWRNASFTQKVVHAAKRAAVLVTETNPRNTSRECPLCKGLLVADEKARTLSCACGWKRDRDFTAAVNHALRVRKVKLADRTKTEPTRKRVRVARRRKAANELPSIIIERANRSKVGSAGTEAVVTANSVEALEASSDASSSVLSRASEHLPVGSGG